MLDRIQGTTVRHPSIRLTTDNHVSSEYFAKTMDANRKPTHFSLTLHFVGEERLLIELLLAPTGYCCDYE